MPRPGSPRRWPAGRTPAGCTCCPAARRSTARCCPAIPTTRSSFEVDVDPARIGLRTEARLWITAAPDRLASVGEAISYHPEVPFVAATTDATNLVASVYCRDPGALYQYLTQRLGTLEGVQHVETSPIVRTLKRAGHPVHPR